MHLLAKLFSNFLLVVYVAVDISYISLYCICIQLILCKFVIILYTLSELIFTCSDPKIQTLEKGVKYVKN